MGKIIRVFVIALIALAVLGINVGIGYALITDFCWIGLLYVPMGLLLWVFPYLMYEFLLD